MSNERPEQVTTTEARAGVTPHMTRYVLGISLALVVVLFAIIYAIAASIVVFEIGRHVHGAEHEIDVVFQPLVDIGDRRTANAAE